MKIAVFCSTSGHSGVDRSMQLMIPELCRRGVFVDQIKVRKHGPNLSLDSEYFREIDSGTSHTMTALPALVKYLKRERPDVLLSDKDRANRVALLAKMLAGVDTRVVVSSGTIMSENLKHRSVMEVIWHKLSMNYLYPKAHAIIVPCEDAAVDLAAVSSLSREQISVVPLPIIDDELSCQAAEPVEHPWLQGESVPVFVAVGELSERKDHASLLKAFAQLKIHHAARLIIVGKGKEEESLKNLADTLDIRGDVDFVGFQNNPYKYIARATALVHTATFEGFGMVLVEALALGKPVIAVDCMGGPKDILQRGSIGYLVPMNNLSSLTVAMVDCIAGQASNTERYMQAAQPYTVKQSVDAYLLVMQRLSLRNA